MAGRGARTTQLRMSISFFILDGLYAVLAASAKEGGRVRARGWQSVDLGGPCFSLRQKSRLLVDRKIAMTLE